MGDLSCFFSQNAVKAENERIVVSKRFLGSDKKPMAWEVRAITSEEDESLRRECTKRIPVSGRKSQYTQETDYNLYLGKLAAKCTVFPNLNDKGIKDS